MEELASERFRTRLRQLRLACRWTQEQAAEACGIGYKLYQLYEIGTKRNPGLITLEKIAKGFGLEIHELLAPAPLPRVGPYQTAVIRKPKSKGGKQKRKPPK